MTPEQIYWGAPRVTAERVAAWEAYKCNYAISCAQAWIEDGSATREQALEGAACILLDLGRHDDQDWAPLGPALADRAGAALTQGPEELQGDRRVRYILNLRTAETSEEVDRIACIAYQLNISIAQATSMGRKAKAASGAPTKGAVALYRHFDASGRLLYVGIANNPIERSEQHQARSKWFRFVDSTTIEWFDTRAEAASAERDAIDDERPVFNDTHNRRNRTAAVDYLLAALDGASA